MGKKSCEETCDEREQKLLKKRENVRISREKKANKRNRDIERRRKLHISVAEINREEILKK